MLHLFFAFTTYIGCDPKYFRAVFKIFHFFLFSFSIRRSQRDISEYFIFFILLDTQVADRDLIGRVIEDLHQHDRRHALFPGMIAEGLAQGMTAYVLLQPRIGGGFPRDAERLIAA